MKTYTYDYSTGETESTYTIRCHLIRTGDGEYTVEADPLTTDGRVICDVDVTVDDLDEYTGSLDELYAETFETLLADLEADGAMEETWYAIEVDEDDNDWGTGSFDYSEAVRMLRETAEYHPDARIAVIKIDQYDSVCDRIITLADLD